jgi:predicted lysophospholipase L1 biosynthesis ABC-type transport system permease subunit
MKSTNKPLEDLDAIRSIMEKSTRFLSLSGLSGVFAGIIALAGSVAAYQILNGEDSAGYLTGESAIATKAEKLLADALIVLFLSITIAEILSYRKAAKKGMRIWTPVSRRMFINMLIPLAAGAFFILILYIHGTYMMIIPCMLVFYGLALVNAGKFTYNEVFYLGLIEIISGFIAALLPQLALLFWAFGFGVLHIVYGIVMYRKYER